MISRVTRWAACVIALLPFAGLPICLAAEEQPPAGKPSVSKPKAARPPTARPPTARPPTARPPTAKPPTAKSLDDELLRELGEEPAPDAKLLPAREEARPPAGDAPGGERARSASQPAKPGAAPKRSQPSANPLDDDLFKQLEDEGEPSSERSRSRRQPQAAGKGGAETGPIDHVTRQMRDVQERLERGMSDAETQQLEKKIVEELEKLIAQANNQSSSSSSSSSSKNMPQQGAERDKANQPKPNQQAGGDGKRQSGPARDSSEQLGKAKTEKADPARLRDLMKDIWGELPPRLRQQMMQSSVEDFVPKYEFEIEEYFKSLAERQQEKP